MRRCVALLATLLLVAGCKDSKDTTAPMTVALHASGGDHSAHSGVGMRTDMTGAEEVPPRATDAIGYATFRLSGDGETMTYSLEVENIRNVFQAHLHEAARGTNGGIVVWLYGATPFGLGASPRRLASGEFTAAQFVGTMRGRSMDDLMAAIRDGRIYVNIHTNDGVDPTNTGPGDFPGGEVRGQLGDK